MEKLGIRRHILILTILALFVCSGLSFLSGLGVGVSLNSGSPSPEKSVPAPTYEPPKQPLQTGVLLFEDDFETASSEEWDIYSDNNHRKGYAEDQYFFIIEAKRYDYWSVVDKTFDNFVVEVETEQRAGPNDNNYGLILRHQDDANFYAFAISGDGLYTFYKLREDELLDIIPWRESDQIKQGERQNEIKIEVQDSHFAFYLNGELVDRAIDPDFEQGKIGLLAGTYLESGTHVTFDNLKVWAIK